MSGADTKERILEAACSLFAAQGYEGTSTRQVGAAADANIGTIAYHFGGKEGLYHAALGRMYERVLAMEAPAAEGSLEDRIRAVIDVVWRHCRSEPDAVRLLLRHAVENGSLPPAVNELWRPIVLKRAFELGAALGIDDLASYRLQLLSLNHLIGRYAIAAPEPMLFFADDDDPDSVIGRHLGDVAVLLLTR
jgi:AcrR family transcriptional regulator